MTDKSRLELRESEVVELRANDHSVLRRWPFDQLGRDALALYNSELQFSAESARKPTDSRIKSALWRDNLFLAMFDESKELVVYYLSQIDGKLKQTRRAA